MLCRLYCSSVTIYASMVSCFAMWHQFYFYARTIITITATSTATTAAATIAAATIAAATIAAATTYIIQQNNMTIMFAIAL